MDRSSDFAKWHVFFSDERYVDSSDPESTYGVYKSLLFSRICIPEANIHKIRFGSNSDGNGAFLQHNFMLFFFAQQSRQKTDAVDFCARDYEQQLIAFFGSEERVQIDAVLLGMGPDGHTASLFPNHALLDDRTRLVASIVDSPKPPPRRVTLTYRAIDRALNVAFVATGPSKQDAIDQVCFFDFSIFVFFVCSCDR